MKNQLKLDLMTLELRKRPCIATEAKTSFGHECATAAPLAKLLRFDAKALAQAEDEAEAVSGKRVALGARGSHGEVPRPRDGTGRELN